MSIYNLITIIISTTPDISHIFQHPIFTMHLLNQSLSYSLIPAINSCPIRIKVKLTTHSYHSFSNYVRNYCTSSYVEVFPFSATESVAEPDHSGH